MSSSSDSSPTWTCCWRMKVWMWWRKPSSPSPSCIKSHFRYKESDLPASFLPFLSLCDQFLFFTSSSFPLSFLVSVVGALQSRVRNAGGVLGSCHTDERGCSGLAGLWERRRSYSRHQVYRIFNHYSFTTDGWLWRPQASGRRHQPGQSSHRSLIHSLRYRYWTNVMCWGGDVHLLRLMSSLFPKQMSCVRRERRRWRSCLSSWSTRPYPALTSPQRWAHWPPSLARDQCSCQRWCKRMRHYTVSSSQNSHSLFRVLYRPDISSKHVFPRFDNIRGYIALLWPLTVWLQLLNNSITRCFLYTFIFQQTCPPLWQSLR